MAKTKWTPTATNKDWPERNSQITYKGIVEWMALHGTEEEKAWLVETVEKNTHPITFQKVDEMAVKIAFLEKMGLQNRKYEKPKNNSTPAEKLAGELKVKSKKK